MNAAADLAKLAADLEASRPPLGSPAATFAAGVRRWLDKGGSLDEALELRGDVGVETARTLYLRSVRDTHLRAAHTLCDGATPWSQSVALAAEVQRFLSLVWPRWRDLAAPPTGCSELRRHLFLAVVAQLISPDFLKIIRAAFVGFVHRCCRCLRARPS